MHARRFFFPVLLAGLLATVSGCGGDDSDDSSDSNGAATSNGATSNGATSNGTSASNGSYAGPAELSDIAYRVDVLTLTKPEGPSQFLNELLSDAIEAGELNVIIRLSGFSSTAPPADLMLQGDSGVDNGDGTYSWEDGGGMTSASSSLTAAGVFSTNETVPVLNFPATIPDQEPLILPLRDLNFQGTLTGEDKITAGSLSGVITKADADGIMVPPVNIPLTNILGEDTLDADSDGDGVDDGWALEATLEATVVEFQ